MFSNLEHVLVGAVSDLPPSEISAWLSFVSDSERARIAHEAEALSAELMAQLAQDDSLAVRYGLANRTDLPDSVLLFMLSREDSEDLIYRLLRRRLQVSPVPAEIFSFPNVMRSLARCADEFCQHLSPAEVFGVFSYVVTEFDAPAPVTSLASHLNPTSARTLLDSVSPHTYGEVPASRLAEIFVERKASFRPFLRSFLIKHPLFSQLWLALAALPPAPDVVADILYAANVSPPEPSVRAALSKFQFPGPGPLSAPAADRFGEVPFSPHLIPLLPSSTITAEFLNPYFDSLLDRDEQETACFAFSQLASRVSLDELARVVSFRIFQNPFWVDILALDLVGDLPALQRFLSLLGENPATAYVQYFSMVAAAIDFVEPSYPGFEGPFSVSDEEFLKEFWAALMSSVPRGIEPARVPSGAFYRLMECRLHAVFPQLCSVSLAKASDWCCPGVASWVSSELAKLCGEFPAFSAAGALDRLLSSSQGSVGDVVACVPLALSPAAKPSAPAAGLSF